MNEDKTIDLIKNEISKYDLTDKNFKTDLMTLIDKDRLPDIRKNYEILKIKTNREETSPYLGVPLSSPKVENVKLIYGIPWTGKTSTFDKIQHFFCFSDKKKSPIKNTSTNIEITIKDSHSGTIYKIDYNSQSSNHFTVLKLEEPIGSEIIDSDLFFTENFSLISPFNNVLFIPESYQNSFLPRYFSNLNELRVLYRNPSLNHVISTFEKKFSSLLGNMKLIQNKKAGLTDKKEKYSNKNESLLDQLKRFDFRISSENELIETRKVYDKYFQEIKKKNDAVAKKSRSLMYEIKQLNNEKQKLKKYLIEKIKDEYDIYISSRNFLCTTCANDLPAKMLKSRMKENKCFVCGIMPYNYKDLIKKDEKMNIRSTKSKIKDIEVHIEELFKENKKILENKADMAEFFNTTKKGIIREIQIYDNLIDLENEIKNSKIHKKKFKLKIEEHKKIIIELNSEISKIDKELKAHLSLYNNFRELFEIIKEYETKLFDSFLEKLLSKINELLIILSKDSSFGLLEYRNEQLVHIEQFRNEEEEKIRENLHFINNDNQTLSQTQLDIINIAIIFSLLSLDEAKGMIAINSIFMDKTTLSEDYQFDIIKMAKEFNFNVYSFAESFSDKFAKFDKKELKRNSAKIRRTISVKNLDEWLKS